MKKFRIKLLPTVFLLCFSSAANCQDSLTKIQSVSIPSAFHRQYLGLDINLLQIPRFFGLECSVFVAPLNCVHLKYTFVSYDHFIIGHNLLDIPFHFYQSNIGEILYHYPIGSTFNGFSIGAYLQWKNGSFKYDELINSYSYPDNYSYKLLIEGVTVGWSIVPKKTKNLIFEFYAGGGVINKMEITRDPGFNQFASNKSSEIETKISTTFRAGFCVGFVL